MLGRRRDMLLLKTGLSEAFLITGYLAITADAQLKSFIFLGKSF